MVGPLAQPPLSAEAWRAQLPYWFGARAAAAGLLGARATHDPHILRYLLDLRGFVARYPAPRLDAGARLLVTDALARNPAAARALGGLGYLEGGGERLAVWGDGRGAVVDDAPALERGLLGLQADLSAQIQASGAWAEAVLEARCAGAGLTCVSAPASPTRVLITVDDDARDAIGAAPTPSFQGHVYPDAPGLDPGEVDAFAQRATFGLRGALLRAAAAPERGAAASLTVTRLFDLGARVQGGERVGHARVDRVVRLAWRGDDAAPSRLAPALEVDLHSDDLAEALGAPPAPLDLNGLMGALRGLAYDAPPALAHRRAPHMTRRSVAARDGRLLGLLARWDGPRLPEVAQDYVAAWLERAPLWRAWASDRLGLHRADDDGAPLLRALASAPGTARYLRAERAQLRALAAAECAAVRADALAMLAAAQVGEDAATRARALVVEATHDNATLPLQLSAQQRVWRARAEGRALPARSGRAARLACAPPPPGCALRLDRALPELTATWTVRTDDGATCDARADQTPRFAPEQVRRRAL